MKLIMMFTIPLLFSGCFWEKDPEPIIPKVEVICVKQYKYQYGSPVKVRVHPNDLEIHIERARYLKLGYDFYSQQVDRNNKNCIEVEKDGRKESK